MSVFDYITDEKIILRVKNLKRSIHNRVDRDNFNDEVYQELYDFMPFNRHEINDIIDRVYRKFIHQDDDE